MMRTRFKCCRWLTLSPFSPFGPRCPGIPKPGLPCTHQNRPCPYFYVKLFYTPHYSFYSHISESEKITKCRNDVHDVQYFSLLTLSPLSPCLPFVPWGPVVPTGPMSPWRTGNTHTHPQISRTSIKMFLVTGPNNSFKTKLFTLNDTLWTGRIKRSHSLEHSVPLQKLMRENLNCVW